MSYLQRVRCPHYRTRSMPLEPTKTLAIPLVAEMPALQNEDAHKSRGARTESPAQHLWNASGTPRAPAYCLERIHSGADLIAVMPVDSAN
jgi:hypothetical protein